MNVTDYPIPARAFAVMDARIAFWSAAGSGRVLVGVTYDREALLEPMGADMLPMIQPVDYTWEETIFGGASSARERVGNTQVVSEITSTFFVAGRREYGLIQRSTDNPEDGKGVLEWVSRLQDALEKSVDDGRQDSLLEGTLAKPMRFVCRQNYLSDLSFALLLEVSLFTMPYWRAGRTPPF